MDKIEYVLKEDRIVKIVNGRERASTNYDKIGDLVIYLNEEAARMYRAGNELEIMLESAKKLSKHLST